MMNNTLELDPNESAPDGRTFLPILLSEYCADINDLLFEQQCPLLQVYRWLSEYLGVTDISYSMLSCYKQAMEQHCNASEGSASGSDGTVNDYRLLARFIEEGAQLLEHGVPISPRQCYYTLELHFELLENVGIDIRSMLGEPERELVYRLMEEIVLPQITEEERAHIFDDIWDEPDLQEWLISAGVSWA